MVGPETIPLLHSLLLMTANSTNPQVLGSFRLENEFFDFAGGVAKSIIDYEVSLIELENFTHDGLLWSVKSRWFRILGFDSPKLEFAFNDEGFRGGTDGGVLKIGAEVVFKIPLFSKTGIVTAHVKNVHTDVRGNVVNHGGRPIIKIRHCRFTIGKIDTKIDAELTGKVLSPFVGWFANMIGRLIPDIICKSVITHAKYANKLISDQPEDIPVWENITAHYQLQADPVFRNDAVDVISSFGFSLGENEVEFNDEIEEFPEFEYGENMSLFSLLLDVHSVTDIVFVLIAFAGAVAMIRDKRYRLFIGILAIAAIMQLILLLIV